MAGVNAAIDVGYRSEDVLGGPPLAQGVPIKTRGLAVAYLDHPAFEKLNSSAKLWRFLDFTKFVDLLESKQLYFTSVAKFDDPYEASLPPLFDEELQKWLALAGTSPDAIPRLVKEERDRNKLMRQTFFVSCWHENEHESAAMWRLHLKSNEGIAVQSSFGRLVESLDKSPLVIHIGKVFYIDHPRETFPIKFVFDRAMHKRKSFEHEREVRALHWDTSVFDTAATQMNGIKVDVDLNALIEQIWVAPTSPAWLRGLVEAVLKRYSINKSVHDSDLDKSPMF
jgi:hypothetical protein